MRSLFLVFANICLLRGGPERVPTLPWFVAAVVVANFLTSYFVSNHLANALPPLALATSLSVTLATTAAISWLVLYLRGFEDRYAATITAIFGCDLFFTAIIGVVATAAGGVGANQVSTGLVAAISMWSIAVNGFILHRAAAVGVVVGIVIAFATTLFGFVLATTAVGPVAQ
jgi:hypothetical protein